MKTIIITEQQNVQLVEQLNHNRHLLNSWNLVRELYKGKKGQFKDANGCYSITFKRDEDATWFLLNI